MRLYVVRHGKAQAASPSGLDQDRELTKRGERQAAFLAGAISAGAISREGAVRVISSAAERARATADLTALACGVEVEHDDRLFVEEPVGPVLDLIASAGDARALCVFGHNNQLTDLVGVLVAGPAASAAWLRTGEASVLELRAEITPSTLVGGATEVERLRLPEG